MLDHEYWNSFYRTYSIRSKDKSRQIEEPCEFIKKAQQSILPALEQSIQLHPAATCRKHSSIYFNAMPHRGSKHVLMIDIKQCYQNVTKDKIEQALPHIDVTYLPDLLNSMLYFDKYDRHRLPTGAPTSPILCNLALTPLDYEIANLAELYGYQYTRYLDDITLSTKKDWPDYVLLPVIRDLVKEYGYRIHPEKSRWVPNNGTESVIVTGVNIGEGNPTPHGFYRKIRARLNNMAFNNIEMDDETQGMLAYIKSIDAPRYQSLMQYFYKRKNKRDRRNNETAAQ